MIQSGTNTRQITTPEGSTIVFIIREHDLDRDWRTVVEWLKHNVDGENYRAMYMPAQLKRQFDIPDNMQAFFVQLALSEDVALMRLNM